MITQRRKYLLKKESGSLLLRVDRDDSLLFSLSLEQLYADLMKRKIKYDGAKIRSIFENAAGEFVDIAIADEGIIDRTLFRVVITPDKMQAYLITLPVINGKKAEREDLQKEIDERQVKEGIKTELLHDILAKQEEYREWLIAEGTDPVDGENAQLIFHFNPDGIEIKPQELENGSVDFYNLNLIQVVETGTVLMEKIPATNGTDGVNVMGGRMPAKPGKDLRLPAGRNTQIIDNDIKLIASASGHVVYSNRKVNVFQSYEVRGDVDFNVGNIYFPGSIIIYGHVKGGFEVEASGDVEVHGNIEGTVSTAGNLQVKNGIVRGKVTAGGSVFARYIENGEVQSGSSIVVTEAIMHSSVKAAKKVSVGGRKGLLVGGNCCAGEEISAKNVGSPLGTVTVLEVGVLPETREEYKEICRKLSQINQEYVRNERMIQSFHELKKKGAEIPADKESLFIKLCRLQYQYRLEKEQLNNRREELEHMFEGMQKAKISVEKLIYTNVTIHMGKSVYTVSEEMQHLVFYLDGYDIKHKPLIK